MAKPPFSQTMLLCIMILLVSILPAQLLNVRAQSTGLVCVNETPFANCPVLPPTIGPVFFRGQAVVNVVGSQLFNGFDISVKANQTILNATLISNIGNIFQSAGGTVSVVAECINGHPVTGSCRAQDGPGVATISAVSNVLVMGGNLFNITYGNPLTNGTTPVTFQAGCTGTSNDSSCVTLFNNSMIDPENLQGATFTTGDFSIAASPSSQTVTGGSSTSFTVTVTSINGFTGTVSLATYVNPVESQGPTSSLSSPSVNLPTSGSSATLTLTVSTTSSSPPGTYMMIVFGESCLLCGLMHSASATLVIPAPDFSITASPASISIRAGSSATFTVTVTSIGGLTGPVSLGSTISPTLRKTPTGSLSPPSVSLVSGGSATSTLTVSTNRPTSPGTYTITVTGNTGSITHTVSVTLVVAK